MKISKILALSILSLMAAIPCAYAGDVPTPVATDSRIKTFVYSENDVFNIVTHYGYQSNIEFGNQEEIETISVGDRVPFQIVPAGRRLFIRAMSTDAHTNMTIVTNKHAYQFDVASVPAPVMPNEELVYVVRFFYPDDKKNAPAVYSDELKPNIAMPNLQNQLYNYSYTLSGSEEISPLQIFDDGRSTWFKMPNSYNIAKIYAISNSGSENLLNPRISGEYTVVDTISGKFAIRSGSQAVYVYNEKK